MRDGPARDQHSHLAPHPGPQRPDRGNRSTVRCQGFASPALMHRLATMTVAALLTELADATANPATAAEPGQQAAMLNPEE